MIRAETNYCKDNKTGNIKIVGKKSYTDKVASECSQHQLDLSLLVSEIVIGALSHLSRSFAD
jgi:hypothetical protein